MCSLAAIAHGFTTWLRVKQTRGEKKLKKKGDPQGKKTHIPSVSPPPFPIRHPSLKLATRTAAPIPSAAETGTVVLAGVMRPSAIGLVSVHRPHALFSSRFATRRVAHTASPSRRNHAVRHRTDFFFFSFLFFSFSFPSFSFRRNPATTPHNSYSCQRWRKGSSRASCGRGSRRRRAWT